jgi:MFS family permease
MPESAEVDAHLATRRRLIRTIFAAVGSASTAYFAVLTVAPLVARDLTGSRTWSGIPGGLATAGAAAGAAMLTAVMTRGGRRTGLTAGYVAALVGAATCIVALERDSFALFLVGILLVGVAYGASQLARFVAADLAPGARRGSVLSWIVWASTIGAVLGPSLLGPGRSIAESLGWPSRASGSVVAVAFYGLALGLVLLLRPDPETVAVDEPVVVTSSPTRLHDEWRLPHVRLAMLVMVSVQVAMVLVMTITPVHMRDHHHTLGVIGLVMSSHYVGMFAFAPVAGRLTDRLGSVPVMLSGLGIAAVAAAVAAASSAEGPILGLGLFGLGLGWSFGFVGGSTLLTRGLGYHERVALQGSVDMVVWASSAVASLASGALIAAIGYSWLCVAGVALLVPALLVTRGRSVAVPART